MNRKRSTAQYILTQHQVIVKTQHNMKVDRVQNGYSIYSFYGLLLTCGKQLRQGKVLGRLYWLTWLLLMERLHTIEQPNMHHWKQSTIEKSSKRYYIKVLAIQKGEQRKRERLI